MSDERKIERNKERDGSKYKGRKRGIQNVRKRKLRNGCK
jgi:hypothetical protein